MGANWILDPTKKSYTPQTSQRTKTFFADDTEQFMDLSAFNLAFCLDTQEARPAGGVVATHTVKGSIMIHLYSFFPTIIQHQALFNVHTKSDAEHAALSPVHLQSPNDDDDENEARYGRSDDDHHQPYSAR